MQYISTRGGGEPKSFMDILLEGLAPDGGLYVPDTYPQLGLELLRYGSYKYRAFEVLRLLAPEFPTDALKAIIRETYSKKIFGSNNIAPLKKLMSDFMLLKLSNGPTLSFKDIPLQFVAPTMQYVLNQRREKLNILGATSGDTGSAAEYAYMDRPGIKVFMLSPKDRMSEFQRRQMYTLDKPNVFNLVVDGPFDDCQAVVKEVNADAEFKQKYMLGAVNSINWARIAAQVVYWVHAYFQATKSNHEEVDFVVPSGNFGNAHSAYVAKRMGLPVRRIIVATNENDVLHQFFSKGVYRIRKGGEVKVTSSPSMDIQSASNFERFMFDYVERNPKVLTQCWERLATEGELDVCADYPGRAFNITSSRVTDSGVLETIQDVHRLWNVVVDPHTAVGVKVGLSYRDRGIPLIVAETAQPAKFAGTIREALGFEPPVPKGYETLGELPQHTTSVDAYPESVEKVKQFIAAHV